MKKIQNPELPVLAPEREPFIDGGRVMLRVRLEDAIALLFFLLTLGLRIFFRELRLDMVSPADVLIIIPAVTLLVAKELACYFMPGKQTGFPSTLARRPRDERGTVVSSACAGGTALAAQARAFQCPDASSIGAGAKNQEQGDLRRFVRPYWHIGRDWFPFFAILMMYYSLWGDATHMMVTRDRDTALMIWDQRLFGIQASLALQRYVRPWLTSWMEFAYFFHLWNIPLVACFLYLRRPPERFREMMCGVLVVTFLGLLGYILVPAIGPLYTLRAQYTVPLRQPLAVLDRQMEFIDFARIQRDVFPSLHVGISFVVWLYAYRNSRRLFWILSPLVLSLWASTVYLRYHYLVDCIAGLFLAPLSFLLANGLFRRFSEVPVRVPVGWTGWLHHLPLWLNRRPSTASNGREPELR